MITVQNLKVYERFDGDDDGWSRAHCPGKEYFSDSDWTDIRNLLQEITCLKRGLVSSEYAERIRKKAEELSESPEAVRALFDLA